MHLLFFAQIFSTLTLSTHLVLPTGTQKLVLLVEVSKILRGSDTFPEGFSKKPINPHIYCIARTPKHTGSARALRQKQAQQIRPVKKGEYSVHTHI